MIERQLAGAILAAGLALAATVASGATVTFGTTEGSGSFLASPYTLTAATRVLDGCRAGACVSLENNKSFTLTRTDGGTFDLTSFWIKFLTSGQSANNKLTVTSGALSTLVTYAAGGATKSLSDFNGIASATFTTGSAAKVLIDDIAVATHVAAATPVPLPAAGGLLFAAVAGVMLIRRKR